MLLVQKGNFQDWDQWCEAVSELCIATEIAEQIKKAISDPDSANAYTRPKTATRRKALQRGRDFIEANIREPQTISEICQAIGVCDRTLESAVISMRLPFEWNQNLAM